MFKGKHFATVVALYLAATLMALLPRPALADVDVSEDARQMRQWVVASRDNQDMPFAIMDKKSARFFVFDAAGHMVGAAPALIGSAPGDHAVPGVGSRPLSQMKFEERTTPAGRFMSEPGRNVSGEDVVWVDYDAALAIHRIRPGASLAQRQARLASANAADHRVSLGCIVLSPAFYDVVVQPTLGRHRGVVYVLPETRSARNLFAALG